jgi:predicted DNA-binding transcriptional regulator AlpA
MKHERPRPEAGGAADDPRQDHLTAPAPADKDLPEGTITLAAALQELVELLPGLKAAIDRQAGPPRMTLRLDEVAASLGVCRRAIERERAAGRFPLPDARLGKVPLWKPETIQAWLERSGRR